MWSIAAADAAGGACVEASPFSSSFYRAAA
jgi:hypothetical protein